MNASAIANLTGVPARWWRWRDDGRIECELCPRRCKLRERQNGFCFVRRRQGDRIELATYGRSSGFCIDPIEKKPLYHFLPGSATLSFGTAGCNLGCRFCQNWDITKVSLLARLSEHGSPEQIATAAQDHGCAAVAFSYNDPVIFAEYAIDVARACRACGIKTIAVTAGYIEEPARAEFFGVMDAANVDLKSFDDDFYRRECSGRLEPVLATLEYLHRETPVWLEVTTLLIPGHNDDPAQLERAAEWFVTRLGADVPWHFTAYHPDFMFSARPTSRDTLERARQIATQAGVRYVYIGNVPDAVGANTWCPHCDRLLIERSEYRIAQYHLAGSQCGFCGGPIVGHFASGPGAWGGRILRLELS